MYDRRLDESRIYTLSLGKKKTTLKSLLSRRRDVLSDHWKPDDRTGDWWGGNLFRWATKQLKFKDSHHHNLESKRKIRLDVYIQSIKSKYVCPPPPPPPPPPQNTCLKDRSSTSGCASNRGSLFAWVDDSELYMREIIVLTSKKLRVGGFFGYSNLLLWPKPQKTNKR